jgi:hypothetical protein
VLALPPPIRAYLERLVRRRWSGRDEAPPLGALPAAMPEAEVQRLVSGGPFGWLMDGRLDVVDGRVALEVLEDSRMAGPDHYRVWEDGDVEALPNEHIGYGWPKDATPEEIERIKQAYFAHNREVQALLAERGFLPRPKA